MLLLFVILAIIFYVLGDLIRGGHLDPEPRWELIGKLMMGLSYAMFVALLIFSIVNAIVVDVI